MNKEVLLDDGNFRSYDSEKEDSEDEIESENQDMEEVFVTPDINLNGEEDGNSSDTNKQDSSQLPFKYRLSGNLRDVEIPTKKSSSKYQNRKNGYSSSSTVPNNVADGTLSSDSEILLSPIRNVRSGRVFKAKQSQIATKHEKRKLATPAATLSKQAHTANTASEKLRAVISGNSVACAREMSWHGSYQQKKESPSERRFVKYSYEESMDIIAGIIDLNNFEQLGGNEIYIHLSGRPILLRRSFHGIREHFRTQLHPKITAENESGNYTLPFAKEDLQKFPPFKGYLRKYASPNGTPKRKTWCYEYDLAIVGEMISKPNYRHDDVDLWENIRKQYQRNGVSHIVTELQPMDIIHRVRSHILPKYRMFQDSFPEDEFKVLKKIYESHCGQYEKKKVASHCLPMLQSAEHTRNRKRLAVLPPPASVKVEVIEISDDGDELQSQIPAPSDTEFIDAKKNVKRKLSFQTPALSVKLEKNDARALNTTETLSVGNQGKIKVFDIPSAAGDAMCERAVTFVEFMYDEINSPNSQVSQLAKNLICQLQLYDSMLSLKLDPK